MVQAGVTDARFFARLGIQTYGFLPLRLPADFRFTGLIHAADERVPADARAEGGPRLGIGRAGAIVAAGFGVFVIRGGFVVARHAPGAAGLEPRPARRRVLG